MPRRGGGTLNNFLNSINPLRLANSLSGNPNSYYLPINLSTGTMNCVFEAIEQSDQYMVYLDKEVVLKPVSNYQLTSKAIDKPQKITAVVYLSRTYTKNPSNGFSEVISRINNLYDPRVTLLTALNQSPFIQSVFQSSSSMSMGYPQGMVPTGMVVPPGMFPQPGMVPPQSMGMVVRGGRKRRSHRRRSSSRRRYTSKY